jgi:hypothetical protein
MLCRQGELKVADVAFKKILGVSARNREHRGSRFMVNPTTGTLEVSIDLRLKVRKALKREVRRMEYGLYLTLTRLYVLKLWLECSGACLKFVNNFGSYLQKLVLR